MALTSTTKTELYQFFAIAFDAAPGVTYMSQLADAANAGMTVKQIVNVFTTKAEFLSIYPNFFTNEQFANKLVENVVGTAATTAAKASAAADITAALNAGWSRGDVIYQVFTNLANKPTTDATWGDTAKLMANQVAYAQYYTEELLGDTTTLSTLKAVIANVTPTSSTNTSDIADALVPPVAKTIALTTGADNPATGKAGDNITATELTLSIQDTLAGGAGNDSLTLTVGADSSADNLTFAMSSVETLVLATGGDTSTQASDTMGLTLDLTDVTDLTLINDTRTAASTNNAGALTVNGLSSTTDVTLGGDATSATFGLKSAGFTGTADDMTINAKAFAGTIAFTNTSTTTQALETLTINGSQAASTITLNTNAANIKTLNLTGNVKLTVTNDEVSTLDTVDGSSMTGQLFFSGADTTGYTLLGGSAADSLVGYSGADNIQGGSGNDTVTGGGGNDTLSGGDGADIITGGSGKDSIVGGAGNDTISGAAGNDTITGGDGADTINAGDGVDSIDAGAGNDTVYADTLTSTDVLVGGADIDVLQLNTVSNTAADTIFTGVSGFESLDVSSVGTAGISLTLGTAFSSSSITTIDFGTDTYGDSVAGSALTVGVAILQGDTVSNTSDSFITGAGADSIQAGKGTDTVSAGAGNDTITLGDFSTSDSIVGGSGVDELTFSAATTISDLTYVSGVESITMTAAGSDTDATLNILTTGDTASDLASVYGGAGADSLDASSGTATKGLYLSGEGGNDTVTGGAGNDSLYGGSGNDFIADGSGADYVDGGSGNDTINSGAGNDTILGGTGADSISLNTGSDNVSAGDSADDIYVQNIAYLTSTDVIDGGAGNDSLTIATAGTLLDAAFTGISSVESLTLSSSSAFTVTLGAKAQAAGVVSVTGGTGADEINAGDYTVGLTVTTNGGADAITTGSGADSVVGSSAADTITTNGGNDTIAGDSGADFIYSGDGNDVITVKGSSANTVDAGSGNDSITSTSTGADTLTAGDGNDTVVGGAGANYIYGGDGADSISITSSDAGYTSAGTGDDTVYTGDTLWHGDTIAAGDGTDVLTINVADSVADADWRYVTGFETVNFTSASGADSINLGGYADSASLFTTLTTGAGNDSVIFASAYDNALTLDLGLGADNVTLTSTQLGLLTLTMGSTAADSLDTLTLSNAGTAAVADSSFTNVTGANALNFSNGAKSITLGAEAQEAGITSVTLYGDTAADTLSASAYTVGLTVDADSTADVITTGSGNDRVYGDSGNDLITLGAGNDYATGDSNADTIYGDAGNDTIDGGANDDVIFLGTGSDSVVGGTGNDIFKVDIAELSAADIIDGTSGTDAITLTTAGTLIDSQLISVSNVQVLNLAAGANSATVSTEASEAGIATVNGASGNDTIDATAYTSAITLNGDSGNDLLSGGTGADTISGGYGDDSIDGGTGADSILAGVGNDTIINLTAGDYASGDSGNDSFSVISTGADTLSIDGGAGNDSISLLTLHNNDSIVGGAGTDALTITSTTAVSYADSIFANSDGLETLTLTAYNDSVYADTEFLDAFDSLATVYLGDGNDSLSGDSDARELDLTIYAGAGNDVINLAASGSADSDGAVVDLGTGNDRITGSDGADTITVDGLTSADTISGGSGSDILILAAAGTYADAAFTNVDAEKITLAAGGNTVTLDSLADDHTISTITGGSGDDVITFGANWSLSSIYVSAAAGNDSITFVGGADTADGGAGNDYLSGGAGADSLMGGADNDTLSGGSGDDTLSGGTGADSIDGGTGNDVIDSGTGNDTVIGGTGNDSITGGTGNNLIYGSAGADTIDGGAGNDTIYGGSGTDYITLGLGSDVVVITSDEQGGADTISDWGLEVDKLDFSNLSWASASSISSQTTDISSGGAMTSRIVVVDTTDNGNIVYIDLNGDGYYTTGADVKITVVGTIDGDNALKAADFIFGTP